ncbi:MAG TPA: radical SAM protein [Thermoplasmatales archaeon]|nr:radical SAM protein [Thermoplasmatales archaeon]
MKHATTIRLLKGTVGNPLTRTLLRGLSTFCDKCGKNRVEVSVELYTGQREGACLACTAGARLIARVLAKGAEAFGLSEEEMQEKFTDPYWARGLASTVRGIAQFGVTKPFTPGAPFQVVWDITYRCNLRCQHCYATAGEVGKDELSTEEALRAIDLLARAGVTVLAFSGGEPLVRPDIFQLTRHAAERGMYVAVATNGTLITREKAARMKENGVEFVQISLDGLDAETHDAFRGVEGAFDRTVEGIKNSVAEGFFVEVSTTVTRHNYRQIPEIIDFSERLGADWFMAYNLVPTGRGRDIVAHDLSPEEREDMLHMLWRELKADRNINVLSTAPQFARVALQQEGKGDCTTVPTHFYNPTLAGQLVDLAEFIGGCGAGRFYLAMRANGDLQPCVFFPLKVGNIRDGDLERVWQNSRVLQELRNKDLPERCGDCHYRYYCGGCRARAYGYTGNYLAPDPGCINNREVYHRLTCHVQQPVQATGSRPG